MTNNKKEKEKEKAKNIFLIALFLSIVLLGAFGIYTLSFIANNIAMKNDEQQKGINPFLRLNQAIDRQIEERDKIIADKKAEGIDTLPQKDNDKPLSNNSKTYKRLKDSKDSEEKEKIEQTVKTIPTSYIYDNAGLLSKFTKQQIIEVSQQLDSDQKAQIIIETIKSLEGQKIEDYSSKRFTKLNLEKNNYNNGILILVAPTERKIRVEVGSGLSDIFSEKEIKDIIKISGVKKCQEQNFDKAISDMFYDIKKKLTKDYSPKKTTSSDFYGVTINWD